MFIRYTKYRTIYFIFSAILIAGSITAIVMYGLKPGIDFTGGSILEISYQTDRPSNEEINKELSGIDLGLASIQPTGDKGVILRMKEISSDTHNEVLNRLGKDENKIEEIRFEAIGPTIGNELRSKTVIVAVLALLAMFIYIALAFRRIQRPLKSWQYGVSTIVTLFHDIIIPLGVFAVLGKYYGVEITIPIIAALLTVLGSSINNTIVVFDRMRENLLRGGESFEEIADRSLNQTLTRQLNTSLTILFTLFALYLFGGETLKYFALALILGTVAGTYSSFFVSGPLLVSWYRLRHKPAVTK
jgi:preprotein translocase subunit SecF